jgi:hypothetical protein
MIGMTWTSATYEPPTPTKRTLITRRKRIVLQRLLNGESRRCSLAALEALRRRGWIHGAESCYQFTETGRRIAEYCETALPGDLEVDLSQVLALEEC